MPTGYTADLYEGHDVSFAEFTMKCARAFGALVTMRDAAWNAEIPEFTVDDYYVKDVDKAQRRYDETQQWTETDAEREMVAATAKREKADREIEASSKAKRERYEAMLAQVESWIPPTPDHQGLKDFMAEQLRESIKFDCSGPWIHAPNPSPRDYRIEQMDRAREALARAKERLAEERERVLQRNNWVRLLRESLSIPA